MATGEQRFKQYEADKALQAEVAAIMADGKVAMMEFMAFAKKHDVAISSDELPKYMEQAKKLGFMQGIRTLRIGQADLTGAYLISHRSVQRNFL